jgi:hypothetical protein
LSTCVTPDFDIQRGYDGCTKFGCWGQTKVEVEFSLRFPTEHGRSWRENNKVWVTLMDGSGGAATPRYRLLFKPNRRQDQYTSYDLRLSRYDGGTETTVQDAWTHTVTPHGAAAQWVNFRIRLDNGIEVYYDNGTGSMQKYIDVGDHTYNAFTHLRFEYKTGTTAENSNYHVQVDNIRATYAP